MASDRVIVSRRDVLRASLASGAVVAASAALAQDHAGHAMPAEAPAADAYGTHGAHGDMMTVGVVDHARNGFDPTMMITEWETGTVETLPDGRVQRSFVVDALDKEIEIAAGVFFPAWTYNGRVPGPALRAKEGERLRIVFRNFGSHPHSMHFHGIHAARMDGVPGAGLINPGEEFTYEFDARPFGCHLYHCHALPLRRHMHKGMYGAFVIDPDPALHPEAASVAAGRLLGSHRERALAGDS
jgi:FtsP/CotA-like multicopper oxidase with cupredoxin domain